MKSITDVKRKLGAVAQMRERQGGRGGNTFCLPVDFSLGIFNKKSVTAMLENPLPEASVSNFKA